MASGKPNAIRHAEWAKPEKPWSGRVEGTQLGTGASIIFFSSDTVGAGPVLHTHPYDELFVVREGRAEFTIGTQTLTAEPGDVLLAPAEIPHTFKNLGPGRLETTDIHLSDRIIQTDLEH